MSFPLLVEIDDKKMRKLLGNYIAVDEKPEVMFEKTMRIPDSV